MMVFRTQLASKGPAPGQWGSGEFAAVACLALALAVPWLSTSTLIFSLTNQIVIASVAAMSVYIMLRMDLLSFALPAFMAIGGYTAAVLAKSGTTDLVVLLAASFTVPALLAVPMGSLLLRLKGTYFVLVTFAFNEVLQLTLFEFPSLTGGANGIAGIPPVTWLGGALGSVQQVLFITGVVGIIAAIVTAEVTSRYRREFAAICDNENLASSLGLSTRKYKTIGLTASAGVAGLAGFALVNMLLTAHPSSFTTMNGFSYIVFAIVGGKGTMLGPLLGAAVLTVATQLFSSRGEYSPALYGALVMGVVMLARNGIAGVGWPALNPRAGARARALDVP